MLSQTEGRRDCAYLLFSKHHKRKSQGKAKVSDIEGESPLDITSGLICERQQIETLGHPTYPSNIRCGYLPSLPALYGHSGRLQRGCRSLEDCRVGPSK